MLRVLPLRVNVLPSMVSVPRCRRVLRRLLLLLAGVVLALVVRLLIMRLLVVRLLVVRLRRMEGMRGYRLLLLLLGSR